MCFSCGVITKSQPLQPQTVKDIQKAREISVIVPVYNEEATVGKVVSDLLELSLFREIVVVDDGSRDGTTALLAGYRDREGVAIITNTKNRGKGCSVIRGLEGVTAPYVVLQDADWEYPVDNLIEISRHKGYDMVVGLRTLSRTGLHNLPTASFLSNKLYMKLLGVPDVFSGQRMLRTSFMRTLRLRSKGFELETELTIRALKRGASLKYIPVEYNPRTREEGKKIGALDFLRISLLYLSLKASLS